MTGFGYAAASTPDQAWAETFLAVRRYPNARWPSVGAPALGPEVTDKGVEAAAWHAHWQQAYGAIVICAPQRNRKQPWSRPWRRWLAGLRQVVETVNGSLHHQFRRTRERPHAIGGVGARVAAKITLHNFCIGFTIVDPKNWTGG